MAIPNTYVCDACDAEIAAEERAEVHRARRAQVSRAIETIPVEFRDATFALPGLVDRVSPASKIEAARIAVHRGFRSLTLTGRSGSGKTTLAAAMLRAEIDRGLRDDATEADLRRSTRARFLAAYEIGKARMQARFGESDPAVIKAALDASVLVIDDLGYEPGTPLALGAVVEVIHDRHAQRKPTITTTGLTYDAVVDRYGDGIARRLFEGATIDLDGGGR